MKLNSLELFGFKSFYNRTVFRFSEGVTALVGPNGCGKSNIVDAIVWVLGERGTKSLRVKEMGDVIFHGSNGRKPVNLAEVTLSLTDRTHDVSIKRRIYRDGASEYYINGEMARLKDVHDLTMGTGIGVNSYAIVEQGNIEHLAQMKPVERRIVIEETSGITRFHEKKREALVRMEEVKTNLERIDDIRLEVNRNLEKAFHELQVLQTYDRLQKRLREIEIDLLSDVFWKVSKKLERLAEKRSDLEKELGFRIQQALNLKDQAVAKESEVALADQMGKELEAQVRGYEKAMENSVVELNYLREEERRLEKAATDIRQALLDSETKTSQLKVEIEEICTRMAAEKKTEKELEAEKDRIDSSRDTTRDLMDRFEKQLDEKREALFVVVSGLTATRNRLAELERAEAERGAREERRISEEHKLGERLLQLGEKERLLKDRAEKAKAKARGLEEESKEIADRKAEILGEFSQARGLVERLRGEKRGKEEISRSLKGKAVEKSNSLPFKQLIDVIRVPKEAEATIERLFSREMGYHVLEEQDAQKLTDFVLDNKSNFVFFPRNSIFNLEGALAELSVTCLSTITEVFYRIDQGEQGIFVADGVCVDSRGFILTTSEGETAGIREAQQKTRLEKEIRELETEIQKHTALFAGREQKLKEIGAEETSVRDRSQANHRAQADAERELLILSTEIASGEERLDHLRAEREFGEEPPEIPRIELIRTKAEYEARKEALEKEMRFLKAEQEKLKEAYEQIIARERDQALAMERKKHLVLSLDQEANRKTQDIERLADDNKILTQKAAQVEMGFAETRRRIAATERSHDEAKVNSEGLIARLEEIKIRLGDLRAAKILLQEELDGLQDEQRKIDAKREVVDRDCAVLEERRQMTLQKLRSEFGVDEARSLSETDERRLEAEKRQISEELPRLGEVNFRSEKEYQELKERFEFLERQKADLQEAVDSLKKTIVKIESFSKEVFLETFGRVNDAFQRYAPMLFKGGKGMLAIEPDSQGVELYVHPPGKKVVRMELLSGGEKALISLSFLLSLMDTKPSPFSLMDEIDAPLDDANLVSLLAIIREISRNTQIVLITHNRITMESSNTIYGITMEEEGISKTIAVKLA
jgi:chromosome segregation protein